MTDCERRIRETKRAICALGPMRPGSLTKQAHRAGGAGGVYYQASYTFRKRGRTDYVRAEDYPRVAEEVANFRRFRELCDELVALSLEWSKSKSAPRLRGEARTGGRKTAPARKRRRT